MRHADGLQGTLDQSEPLHDVTFCIVDLETTGGSPAESAITEVGAVTYRGGERIGVFHTPVSYTHLTLPTTPYV